MVKGWGFVAARSHISESRCGAPVSGVGTSMGGLVSAEETQGSQGRIGGALTTCGLVAGALGLNNYQLDGEYALNELLAPGQQIQLVRYATADQAAAAATALATVTGTAQATAQGRARVALGAALLNEPTWFSGATEPSPTDYGAQEQQQADELSNFVLPFIMGARYQIELAAGGNSSFTKGVNYARVMRRSSFLPEVKSLYRAAGLSLDTDLADLDRARRGRQQLLHEGCQLRPGDAAEQLPAGGEVAVPGRRAQP